MSELTISVTIADRPYRLTVKREEEENIRKAAGEINNKVKSYAENFAYNDKQDLLAMVTLEMAINRLQLVEREGKENDTLKHELIDIDSKLQKMTD